MKSDVGYRIDERSNLKTGEHEEVEILVLSSNVQL